MRNKEKDTYLKENLSNCYHFKRKQGWPKYYFTTKNTFLSHQANFGTSKLLISISEASSAASVILLDAEEEKIKDTALFEKEFIISKRRHPPKQFNYKQISAVSSKLLEVNTGCGRGPEKEGTAVGDQGRTHRGLWGKDDGAASLKMRLDGRWRWVGKGDHLNKESHMYKCQRHETS